MAFIHSPSTSRPRWRDAPQPARPQAEPGTFAAGGRARGLSRRRRLLLRGVPMLLALAGIVVLIAWATGPNTMTPAEVSENAHEQVLRDVISRTGDFSMTVGRLDCVEMHPGRGNCLADARSKAHRADNLMIAVGYVVDPGNGQLELVVKLP